MSCHNRVSGWWCALPMVQANCLTICSLIYDAIAETQPDLSALRFGAVGLGNHEYDLFCGAIRSLDALLIARGAQRMGDRLEIDVLEHEIPEGLAERLDRRSLS